MVFEGEDRIRELISKCKWTWARTYLDIPHEYIARYKCELLDSEFVEFFNAQRRFGIKERWANTWHQYLYLDGYKYWTMGNPLEVTKVMNRQKLFDEFDTFEWPLERYYSESEHEATCETIIRNFDKPVFEIGLGNGEFVKSTKISPDRYYGIDPSRKAIERFRKNVIGYYKCCSTKAFEETHSKWSEGDKVVIALFGTASYLMEPYLKLLAKSKQDYFLMFFKDDYYPESLRGTHSFVHTKEELKALFPECVMYNHKNYITVSSKPVEWMTPRPKYEQASLF
jgi:hypothetical protein